MKGHGREVNNTKEEGLKMQVRKQCEFCGKEFVAHRWDMRFCSRAHKYEFVVRERQLALAAWRKSGSVKEQRTAREDAAA
jgi:hypothetical protein